MKWGFASIDPRLAVAIAPEFMRKLDRFDPSFAGTFSVHFFSLTFLSWFRQRSPKATAHARSGTASPSLPDVHSPSKSSSPTRNRNPGRNRTELQAAAQGIATDSTASTLRLPTPRSASASASTSPKQRLRQSTQQDIRIGQQESDKQVGVSREIQWVW